MVWNCRIVELNPGCKVATLRYDSYDIYGPTNSFLTSRWFGKVFFHILKPALIPVLLVTKKNHGLKLSRDLLRTSKNLSYISLLCWHHHIGFYHTVGQLWSLTLVKKTNKTKKQTAQNAEGTRGIWMKFGKTKSNFHSTHDRTVETDKKRTHYFAA